MNPASTVQLSAVLKGDASPCERRRDQIAQRLARRLALGHYENFTVVSLGLPRHLRQHFCNIYAFCRHADDLADEIADPATSLARLAALKSGVRAMYAGERPAHWVLRALRATIAQFNIPPQPFLDLIDAFEQDRRVSRYLTYADVLDYCRRSANPVGHLVLYLHGYRDPRRQELSDFTCTALQLTNFWQDIVPDVQRGRIYLPQVDLAHFRVDDRHLTAPVASAQVAALVKFQVDRTEELFAHGDGLLPLLRPGLRRDISLFSAGGRAILQQIRRQNYDTLAHRPKLGKAAKLALLARAAFVHLFDN